VLDADSEHLAQFDEADALYLGELAKILERRFEASSQAA
ncbi:TPA: GAF domain-containing protein, partial [Neisseria gonorrhoeae]